MKKRISVVGCLEEKVQEMLTRSVFEYPSSDIQPATGNQSLKLRV